MEKRLLRSRKRLWRSLGAFGAIIAVAVILLLGLLLSDSGTSGYIATVKEDGTKVFESANENGDAASEIAAGQEVIVISEMESNGTRFAHIEYNPVPAGRLSSALLRYNVSGYVRADALEKVKDVDLAEVPDFDGLTGDEARSKAKKHDVTLDATYAQSIRTGDEVVTFQLPPAGMHMIIGEHVYITLDDARVSAAYTEAHDRIREASEKLDELRERGLDTTDLETMLQKAAAKHEGAKTIVDLVGETDSVVYFANLVIQGADAK